MQRLVQLKNKDDRKKTKIHRSITIGIFTNDQRRFSTWIFNENVTTNRSKRKEFDWPSSRETRFKFDFAAASWIFLPIYCLNEESWENVSRLTSTEPVKAILSIFSCTAMALPHSGPSPRRSKPKFLFSRRKKCRRNLEEYSRHRLEIRPKSTRTRCVINNRLFSHFFDQCSTIQRC